MAGMTSPSPHPLPDQPAAPGYSEPPSPTVQYYQDVAAKQESSPVRWLIKLCRAITWVFYAVVIINTILIGVAFLLELFGANPEAGFVEWVYRSTARAMQPFHDIFPPVEISDQSTLDTSLLFAIVIYLILIVALHTLLNWLQRKLIEQQTKMLQARATADAVAMDEQSRIAAAQAYAREQAARQDAARQEAARQQAHQGCRHAPGGDAGGGRPTDRRRAGRGGNCGQPGGCGVGRPGHGRGGLSRATPRPRGSRRPARFPARSVRSAGSARCPVRRPGRPSPVRPARSRANLRRSRRRRASEPDVRRTPDVRRLRSGWRTRQGQDSRDTIASSPTIR